MATAFLQGQHVIDFIENIEPTHYTFDVELFRAVWNRSAATMRGILAGPDAGRAVRGWRSTERGRDGADE